MKNFSLSILGLLAIGLFVVLLFPVRTTIGPANPGAESGSDQWWVGTSGNGYLFVDHADPASGTNDFTLGNTNQDKSNSAGWRSVIFPLGPAAAGARPMTFSFAYKLTDEVNSGDNVLVQFRFFNRATNWIIERDFLLGDSSHDSAMNHYKTVTTGGIYAPHNATLADINVTANFYGRHWSSGDARFDDFSVTTTKHFGSPAALISATVLVILAVVALSVYSRSRRQS